MYYTRVSWILEVFSRGEKTILRTRVERVKKKNDFNLTSRFIESITALEVTRYYEPIRLDIE